MGYRSEVAYVIRFKDKADLDTFIGVQLVKKDEHITNALRELKLIESASPHPVLYFYADSVKWYDGYKDVESHHQLMRDAVDMFDDSGWHFMRVGEEHDDVVDECDGDDTDLTWEYLTINRPTINTDVGNTKPILTEEGELA